MVENRLPDRTLKETFESVFYPLTGADPVMFQELADGFYETIFPSLNKYTAPIPEARDLVRRAQGRGYQLAIATNPLFPRQAIDHRLSWANLPSSEFRFDLVTSYESFHFSKPDPAFLAEVMGRLGWPEGPVVVVGDDCERDINPAGKLGLAAYCVNSQTRSCSS